MKTATKKFWKIIFLIYRDRIDSPPSEGDAPNYRISDVITAIEPSVNFDLLVVENKVSYQGRKRTDETNVSVLEEGGLKLINTINKGRVLQDGKKLGDVFKSIEDEYKSDQTILVTWDHGSAFGIFLETGKNEKITNILTSEKLAFAISKGFGKVDVLIMLNCIMQNMHTCYALKKAVGFLVAPEGGIVEPGYDYVAITDELRKETPVDARAIAHLAVDSMRAHYKKWNWLDSFEMQAVFAFDLTQFGNCMTVFNNYVDQIIDLVKTREEILTIQRADDACYKYDFPKRYGLVDLIAWLRYLQKEGLGIFGKMADEMETAYENMTVHRVIGNNPYSSNKATWEIKNDIIPKGAAIHIPSGLLDLEYDVNKYFISPNALYLNSFLKETRWLELFNSLYIRRL